MIYKNLEQGSTEWLELRRKKLTASNFTTIMKPRGLGVGSQTLANRIAGDHIQIYFEESFVSDAMQNGKDLEKFAVKRYEQEELCKVETVGFIVPDNDYFLGYSPDGLVDDDGLIEIKCPGADKHISNLLADECPKEYLDQIQGGLYLTGREYCDFISYNIDFEEDFQFKTIRVFPDRAWQEKFKERVEGLKKLVDSNLEKFKL